MNSKQRRILVVTATIIAITLLFPPYYFFLGIDVPRETNLGYSFVFSPPVLSVSRGASDPAVVANVHWALLLIQWVGVILIAGLLWLAAKD
ncbi:MAG: hypothetical protein Q8O52_08610 [Sulfuritalea sp.]|jgi:hypothetical protein|nr:hypothetical protein [Sulfuritalea sp.]